MSFTYKGLKAKLERHVITAEEVDRQLQRLVQENPRITDITNRPAQLGDELVLDYAGFCDGEQFAGGTAENQTLTLGSGAFIPGFEEQLVGAVPGQQVTVEVTFPEQYHAENLAGKPAQFRCTVHAIRNRQPYPCDDVFAREVGGCESLEAMRTKLQQSMQAYADNQSEMELQDQLLRQAALTLEYTPTPAQIKQAIDEQMKVLQAQLAQQGLSLEMYCSFMKTTQQQLRQDSRAAAEAALLSQAAVEQIIALEGLTAEPDDIEKAVAVIASRNQMTVEQLAPYRDEEFEKIVVKSVLTGKVMRLIRDAAQITGGNENGN